MASMESLYRTGGEAGGVLGEVFGEHLFSHPRALRNRLKIVEDFLVRDLRRVRDSSSEFAILSVGCGSSRSIVDALLTVRRSARQRISVTCVDRDARALDFSRELVRRFRLTGHFRWLQGDVRQLQTLLPGDRFAIVEMVGLLDYFSACSATALISQIRRVLAHRGALVFSSVCPNPEAPFVSHLGWPKMYYKTTHDVTRMLARAGFADNDVTLVSEPFRLHLIGLARQHDGCANR